jgi:hypothetical protein
LVKLSKKGQEMLTLPDNWLAVAMAGIDDKVSRWPEWARVSLRLAMEEDDA